MDTENMAAYINTMEYYLVMREKKNPATCNMDGP